MERRSTWTTAAVAAAWAACVVLGAGLVLVRPELFEAPAQLAGVAVLAVVNLVLGTLVARRAPGNAVGPLLAAAGAALWCTNALRGEALGPFEGVWTLLYLSFAVLLIVVPDGRPASPGWRRAAWALIGVVAAFILGTALVWLFPAAEDAGEVIGLGLLVAFSVLLLACALAPVLRYRRADERTRLQLRWVYLTGASLPLTLMLCWVSYLVLGAPDLVVVGLVVMYVAIPAGATIAVLRPELGDIDRAAVATVAATILTALMLGVVSLAGAIVGTAMVNWSPPAATVTTAVLTLVLALAYPRVRNGLDRLLYPERARGVAALRALTRGAERGAAAPEDVEPALRTALRDPGLQVAYLGPGGVPLSFAGRRVVAGPSAAVVRLHGEEVGWICPSSARAKRAPAAVVRAAAPLVAAARAKLELARARAEVEASRERLLRAGYDERRRLERDLHDGAQQRLVALGMHLRVLQRSEGVSGEVASSLDTAVAELGTAVAELRQLAHGVRPSALDDGLGAALVELTRLAPSTVELDVQALELPDAVATTAYYVVSEAIINALRHADATRIRVVVRHSESEVTVRVVDDGTGGAAMRTTGGLTGLADRVSALGGQLVVTSPQRAGTTVEAKIPCASS